MLISVKKYTRTERKIAMNILIVGSGAREHAIGYKIHIDNPDYKLYFAPGNAGCSMIGECVDILATEKGKIVDFAKNNKIDFVVIGPEDPLCEGLADALESERIKVFGVKQEAARLEESKAYAKEFMNQHNMPTAKYKKCTTKEEAVAYARELRTNNPSKTVVLKADGLCQGKGVVIAENDTMIESYCSDIFDKKIFGETSLVVEEYLDGFEISQLCFVDNHTIVAMPTVKDHKKIYEGEKGDNTGGMGTYSPNLQGDAYYSEIEEKIMKPFMEGLKKENLDFRGVIFFGLMVTTDGVKVLEFNTRFGDPETQSIMLRLDTNLMDIFVAVSENKLNEVKPVFNDKKVITTVMASNGYPKKYEKGAVIEGLDKVDEDVTVFHAGTSYKDGKIVTNGGRVLSISTAQDDFETAYDKVYDTISKITFDGAVYRKDISPLVKRVYVAKKDNYDIESEPLKKELEESLKITIPRLKIYQRYDIQNLTDEEIRRISRTILSESPVDDIYLFDDALQLEKRLGQSIVVKYHRGQFDQREQGLIEAVAVAIEKDDVLARSEKVYFFEGDFSESEWKQIESLLINPVDQQKGKLLGIPTTLEDQFETEINNEIYEGFIEYTESQLKEFFHEKSLAMSFEDLLCIYHYFKEEKRNPSHTELDMLDTYWSDHCRHTTFQTILEDVHFPQVKNKLDELVQQAYEDYLNTRTELNRTKPVTLMDLATIVARYMRANGSLEDLEVSEEINACSIKVKVRVGNELEDYLLMFKNETHNHPTEIEPFGGAATCLGGAIRDPLSGRAYVYQAMRVTGSADPKESLEETLPGKLPQRKITQGAAKGYSSYGNQIGLTTGLVDEIYHEGYKAKRMEVGAVIAAAPAENVKREEPVKGDVILLLGGKTGRDGVGGATGSSKVHTADSITTSSAEVQKGNAPTERKIQRLFRNPDAAKMIKKCNDFGAGGVSVAIGELADSLEIHLENVPLKYLGLTPREIAISESQERMAVVLDAREVDRFMNLCYQENLEVTKVAEVTDTGRLIMKYNDMVIVDLSRVFLNSAGASRRQSIKVESVQEQDFFKPELPEGSLQEQLEQAMSDLNRCSKKTLVERFDSSIGKNTVLSPLGGEFQITPSQAMVAKIPSLKGNVSTVSIMSYGFDPYLSEKSTFLGAYYAVVESLCKIAAVGANALLSRLSFQEYFEKLGEEDTKWAKPFMALLGAYKITKELNIPPIGGKDSMSGTFHHLSVPPTLISFAVATEDIEQIISTELKGNAKLGLLVTDRTEEGVLDIDSFKRNLETLRNGIKDKNIISCNAITHKGSLPLLLEMAMGNNIGIDVSYDESLFYEKLFGSFVIEYKDEIDGVENIGISSITNSDWIVNGEKLKKEKISYAYRNTLEKVFSPEIPTDDSVKLSDIKPTEKSVRKSTKPVDVPKVIIPVFPGTNCEYDSANAFEQVGAKAEIFILNNLSIEDMKKSIDELARKISESQILFIPGGFSLGDEPDGSGKFIASVIRNPKIAEAINHLLTENDGLILGICNGFQALIKTGLLPHGKICDVEETSPTLTYNNIGRHIARMVDTKVVSMTSPWLSHVDEKQIYRIPISHGEGRFICTEEMLNSLKENGQIAFAYLDNPNGSVANIEGITSPDGKILGKMAHSERVENDLYKNIPNMEKQQLFRSGVEYFLK